MISNISKYKRLFTIGCSFTQYWYPTWANILNKSIPNVALYNLGKSGSSNPFIANRLVEGNLKFKFCETDLVIVMWTTVCREAHYVNGTWRTPGNIFTQDMYNKEFVDKFADPDGYLIRDMATIEMATSYAKNLSCDYIGLLSTPLDYMYDPYNTPVPVLHDEIFNVYKTLLSSFPRSLFELEMNNKWELYHYGMNSDPISEYHPTPTRYCNYLTKLGFPITQDAIDYAAESTQLLSTITDQRDFVSVFPQCHYYNVPELW